MNFVCCAIFVSLYLDVILDQTLSYREHLEHSAAGTTWSRNSLVLHGVPAQAHFAHQPWLFATQSQNTAVQRGLDPATQISSTPNFIVQCAWFQAACNPRSSHGFQCSAMLHLNLFLVKQQLTLCFRSWKPNSPSKLACICWCYWASICVCGLHLDAEYTIRYDTRCYFNVRLKADIGQLNLPHGTDD